MTLWQLNATRDGYKAHNGIGQSDKPTAPTEAEFEAIVARFADV